MRLDGRKAIQSVKYPWSTLYLELKAPILPTHTLWDVCIQKTRHMKQ